MGERKGQNKYYPPDFDPKKHGNLNRYHGTHALRERASKIDQGILVIRFEMPYNIWCLGCNAHIAMGVRYNAEKRKVGAYLSTPIHEFRMKCHLCDQYFEIRTDPKNMDYVIMSGARRKEQRWDAAENGQIVTDERADIKRLAVDAMFGLEHEFKDKDKAAKLMPTLSELEDVKSEWRDDYRLNSMMRNVLRSEKKELNEQKAKDQKLLKKWNLDIKLVAENEKDVRLASLYKFNTVSSENEEESKNKKRKSLETESIFNETSAGGGPSSLAAKKKLLLNISEPSPGTSRSSLLSSSSSSSSEKANQSKQNNMEFLRKQINKSYKEKKLVSTGFGAVVVPQNVGSKEDEGEKKAASMIVLVKKNRSEQESNSKQTPYDEPSRPPPPPAGLVSNDYGSDSD